ALRASLLVAGQPLDQLQPAIEMDMGLAVGAASNRALACPVPGVDRLHHLIRRGQVLGDDFRLSGDHLRILRGEDFGDSRMVLAPPRQQQRLRSEERRVGKECRSRWATYD